MQNLMTPQKLKFNSIKKNQKGRVYSALFLSFERKERRACETDLQRKAQSIILTNVSYCVMRITQLSQVLISYAIFDEVQTWQ